MRMSVKLCSEGYKINEWKRYFLLYRKCRHDAQITWPYAYYVTLGSHCKMAYSSSEDETDTLPERPTRIQPYQFEPVTVSGRILKEYRNIVSALTCGILWGLWNHTHWSACYTNRSDAAQQESSYELYKLNPLSPHCRSIARELVHCYTWGRLWIVTVRGNTVGQHS